MLTNIPAPRETEKLTQRAFGGLELRPGARSGVSRDGLALVVRGMENMSGDFAPLLTTRRARYTAATLAKPNGLTAYEGEPLWVDGTRLYYDGVQKNGTLTDSPKVFATLGHRLLIWPDKKMWDGETLSALEESVTASGLVFGDGTYAQEQAKANSITTAGDPFPFRAGDAVTITGCAVEPANNKTPIVREISDDGRTLRFYENTFTIPEGESSVTEPGQVTLARTVPDLDFLCVNENRVWGCKGDTIFCSKLGDPYNWNVYDGLSTDSWSVESGTAGGFTGCCSFMGYPVFFKEDRVFKVYGSRPSNFELMGAATLGVLPGSAKSLAVAGETLFYLSRAGICAYTGGFPSLVGQPLEDGRNRWAHAAAGSDGRKYYVSLYTGTRRKNVVYDTQLGAWYEEDGVTQTDFAWSGSYGALFALGSDKKITTRLAPDGHRTTWPTETAVTSGIVFDELDMGVFGGKYPVRLWLRYVTVGTASVRVDIRYDGGEWETAGTLPARAAVGTCNTPVPIRRCDRFAVRLVCETAPVETSGMTAGFTLHAIELDVAPGVGSRK